MEALCTQRLRLSLRAILSCFLLFLAIPTQAVDFAAGTGEPSDPYQIATAEQLISIGSDPNLLDKHFILINDIDLDPNLPGGQVFDRAVIAPDVNETDPHFQGIAFTGSLDGQGYSITNLTIDSDSEYAGLFGLIGKGAVVRHVRMVGGSVRGAAIYISSGGGGRCGTGSLAGENRGLIQNCHTDVNITGLDFVGGLVGENHGIISNSSSSGSVYGESRVGGLVGINSNGMIANSTNTGAVKGADSYVGGLVGYNVATILNSYSTGVIDGLNHVGGLVGINYGVMSTSYSTGRVNGLRSVGGLVGGNQGGAITNSYSVGLVHGAKYVGGLVGTNSGSVTNSYSTGSVNEAEFVGGLVGGNSGTVLNSFWDKETSGLLESNGGIGLVTTRMQDSGTYLGYDWDFLGEGKNGTSEIWQIPTEGGYPEISIFHGYAPPLPQGAGTWDDPYLVKTPEDLSTLWYRPAASYRLVVDIDLSGIVWSTAVVPAFVGWFDGQGHSIRNLTIFGGGYLGLFGTLGRSGVVIGLSLEDVNIVGTDSFVGGLAGLNSGTVLSSYSQGVVSGLDRVGGLIGYNNGVLANNYNVSSIKGTDYVGGLVGYNNGTVSNSFNTGSVKGMEYVGGLVGDNYNGTIMNSYSTGSVAGDHYAGGLVGFNEHGTVLYSFWDMETSGMSESDGGAGLITSRMQDPNTYLEAGWDFLSERQNGTSEIWLNPVEDGYPVLSIFEGYVPPLVGGAGTSDDPYIVTTPEELGAIWYHPAASYRLAADIDLSETTWSTAVVPVFAGKLDGHDYCIQNLSIRGKDRVGLFGSLAEGAVVFNLGLENVGIVGTGEYVGSLVGYNLGVVSNSYCTGTVNGTDYVGSLIGLNYSGMILDCHSTVTVSGTDHIGGLVGVNRGIISNSVNSGSVDGQYRVGGLVGTNSNGTITGSSMTGTVNGVDSCVGGLVGYNKGGRVKYVACSGEVWGMSSVGGLVGCNNEGTVTDSTSRGTVGGIDNVGGLVGSNGGSIRYSTGIGSVNGQDNVGGIVGVNRGMVTNSSNNSLVSGENDVGGLVGCNDDGKVSNSSNSGTVSGGGPVGGLVGDNEQGTVSNSSNSGTVNGIGFVGGLVGYNSGIVSNSFSMGSVDGKRDSVGGLVGYNDEGTITNSYSTNSVSGEDDVGGLVGFNNYGIIANTYSDGFVSGLASVAGLIGQNNYGTVSNSYSMCSIRSEGYAGGMIGMNDGVILNSYCTGSIEGMGKVGGLIGYNFDGFISNCYSSCSVSGQGNVGGLVGENKYGAVSNSFWDKETSGVLRSDGGIGLSTVDMQNPNIFLNAGWDLLGERKNGVAEIWQKPAEGKYPVLSIFNGYVPPLLAGAGTLDDPYVVATPEDLGAVLYRPTAIYQLSQDVDMSGIVWSTAVIPCFAGKFDGQGHRIHSLSIRGGRLLGFFGIIGLDSSVSDLGLENVDVESMDYFVGGLIGYNQQGSVKNCYTTGSVSGLGRVGGLVGYIDYGVVNVSNCYSMASVNGQVSVGGLVGFNLGSIANSYITGSVSGTGIGSLTGTNGGLVTNCFWDMETSSVLESGGGLGLTTVEMQDPNTYLDAGWDFDRIWSICEGVDYPHLQWENVLCE